MHGIGNSILSHEHEVRVVRPDAPVGNPGGEMVVVDEYRSE